jgi:hypothetical protein
MIQATTAIQVCSRALLLIGADPITSFEDGTTEAVVANAIYEDYVRGLLSSMRWRFATKQFELNRLVATPTGRWSAAYTLPSDSILVNTVTENDCPIKYDIYSGKVFCDAGESSSVVADYIFRALEANWPPYFTLGVELALAAMFATSIARDTSLNSMMEQKAQFQLAQARRLDSQNQTTRNLFTSRFIAERRT